MKTLILFLSLVYSFQLLPCKCNTEHNEAPVSKKYDDSFMIFYGKITGVKPGKEKSDVSFKVIKPYKGLDPEKDKSVTLFDSSTDCGQGFHKNSLDQEYLVYVKQGLSLDQCMSWVYNIQEKSKVNKDILFLSSKAAAEKEKAKK